MADPKLIAEFRRQHEPQLDEMIGKVIDALQEASAAEVDRCIKIAEACAARVPQTRGPDYEAGWEAAVDFVVEALTAWKQTDT